MVPVNMADLQSEFSELIELLEKVHHSCEKKRQEIELSCQDYREILAPWPEERKSAKQEEKREEEGEVSKGEGAAGDIPEREIQELKLLDNVLAKAQKVRKRHERTVREDDLHEEHIINEATVETSNQRYDEDNCKVKDTGERTESGRINQPQVGNGTSRGKTVQGNDQVATISKTKLNRLINTSSAKTPSVSVKVLPPKSTSRPPGGVMKKSYKLQAPYKTEPTRPKVSSSRAQRPGSRPTSASARTSQVSQTRSLSTRSNVTSASRKVPESKNRTVARPPSQHTNDVVSSSVTKHTASTSEDLPEMVKEVERNPANQQSSDIAKWLEDVKLSGIGEGDQVTTAAQHKEDQDTEKKRFLLKDDAGKLVIPGKWKKLCVQNHKLRQRIQEMQPKQEQSTHRQHFVDRLESRFSNNEEEYSDVEVPYELVDIQRKKGRLLEMVEEADIQSLSQESSFQDICHAKVLLEFIHSQLQELISDVSQIENTSTNAVKNSKQAPLSALTSAAGMSETSSVDSQMWLPGDLVHRKCVEMSSFPEAIVYHDPKDLKRIVTLQHEAQILQLQIHIQKLVGDKILPILQTMDRKNPTFLSLYRTVYSILTTGGERFPTLVRDV